MRNIAIIDETFDANITSTYHLSLQLGADQFSFAILDTIRMKYIAFKNYWYDSAIPEDQQGENLRNLINSEGYLSKIFKSVHFMYQAPGALLIPGPLFNPDFAGSYFKYSGDVSSDHTILFRKIPSIDSFLVHQIPTSIYDLAVGSLAECKFFHQASPQIEDAVLDGKNKSLPAQVYADIHQGFIDLMLLNSGQLVFYNSFIIRNKEDIIYFILYLFDQFGLSQEETPLILSGFVEAFPDSQPILEKYLKKISYLEFNKSYSYSYTFNNLVQHHFAHLINLARCE
jgi:hypothetical protein